LLFEPYSQEDIESIVEMKKNNNFRKCVPTEESCKGNQQMINRRKVLKEVFFNLIDEKAIMFLSKRIS
jgi:hypothetical protein